jgi:hypothetical protein
MSGSVILSGAKDLLVGLEKQVLRRAQNDALIIRTALLRASPS